MAKRKKPAYYAVRVGRVPGIYRTWDECRAQTRGHSGAVFKGFGTEAEAASFVAAASSGGTCVAAAGSGPEGGVQPPPPDPAASSRRRQFAALRAGEYEARIPLTEDGLLLVVREDRSSGGNGHGPPVFARYRTPPTGEPGPAESMGLIRNVGDRILAVEGIPTAGRTFDDVADLLRDSTDAARRHGRAGVRFRLLEAPQKDGGLDAGLPLGGDDPRVEVDDGAFLAVGGNHDDVDENKPSSGGKRKKEEVIDLVSDDGRR